MMRTETGGEPWVAGWVIEPPLSLSPGTWMFADEEWVDGATGHIGRYDEEPDGSLRLVETREFTVRKP